MVREVIEARETLHAETTPVEVTRGTRVEVSSVVIPSEPQEEEAAEDFTREAFEGALDKAGRRIRGKYADVPTSSEEFARRKQEEIELEERR